MTNLVGVIGLVFNLVGTIVLLCAGAEAFDAPAYKAVGLKTTDRKNKRHGLSLVSKLIL